MDRKNLPVHETHDTQAFFGSKHFIREIFCAFFMCSNQSPNSSQQSYLHRKKPCWKQPFHAAFHAAYFWHDLHLKVLLHKSCSAIWAIFSGFSSWHLPMVLVNHITYLLRDLQSPRMTPNFCTVACNKYSLIRQHAFSVQLYNIKVFSPLLLPVHDSMTHFLLVNITVSVNNPSWWSELFCLC